MLEYACAEMRFDNAVGSRHATERDGARRLGACSDSASAHLAEKGMQLAIFKRTLRG